MLGAIDKLLFLFALTGLFGQSVLAQDIASSPYSRYGIGDLQPAGVTQNLAMGGVNVAVYSSHYLNYSNPAAYGRLVLTTFDAGINAGLLQLRNDSKQENRSDASVGYFSMAFPLKPKKSSFGFGIVPLSHVGYSINDQQVNVNGDAELHVYEGKGGLNQIFLSTGFTPFKQLTAGVTASYLFGDISQQRLIEFSNSSYLNTRLTDNRDQNGFHYNFGLQYTFDSLRLSPSDSVILFRKQIAVLEDSLTILFRISKNFDQPSDTAGNSAAVVSVNEKMKALRSAAAKVNRRHQRGDWGIVLGATYSPSSRLNANRSTVAETFRYLDPISRDQIVVKDTTYNMQNESGVVQLPSGLGFGVSIRKGTRWLISSDIRLQDWSIYRSYNNSDSLANSYRISGGIQFVPDDRSFAGFWKQVQYMTGAHYSNSFLSLRGTQLTEIGVSAGLGIPVRRGMAHIRLMSELGRRGTSEN
ncbi:MAG: hypothetical protein ACKO1U_01730, partial [Bacteroidota bacterium]